MKEDLSTLTDASLPVRPNSTLFMCAEKVAAVYMSPFLFCGETKNKRKQTIKKGKGRRSTFARLKMNGGRKTSQLGCFSKSFTSLRMWFGQRITPFIVSWQGKTPRWNEAPVANHPERGADSLRNTPKNVESAKSTPDRLCHRAKPPLSR